MSRRPREGRKPGRNKNGVSDPKKGNRVRQQRAFRARSNGLPTARRLAKEQELPRTHNERVLAVVCPTCGESGVCRKLLEIHRYKPGTDYQDYTEEKVLGPELEQPHQDRWEAAKGGR